MSNELKEYIKAISEAPAEQASPDQTQSVLQPEKMDYQWSDFENDTALKGRSGVGPGEDRLAEILGGEVQGQSESFDLNIPDGEFAGHKKHPFAGKWEVKAPDAAGTIRPGTEGITAFGPINKTLRIAVDELAEFLQYPGVADLAEASESKTQYDDIVSFFAEKEPKSEGGKVGKPDASLTQSGEITENRFERIMDVLESAKTMVASMQGELLNISVDDTEYQVTPTKMLKISQLLGISDDDTTSALGASAEAARALSSLNSEIFDDATALRTEWETSIKADEVFDLTGIILVTPDGFMMVKKPYGDKIKFNRVTQGKPRFKTPVKGASGKGVWGEGFSKDESLSSVIKEEYQNEKKILQEHANKIVRAQNRSKPAIKRLIFEAFSSQEKDQIAQIAAKKVDEKWKKELMDKVEKLLDKQARGFFSNDHFYKAVAGVWKQLMRVYAEDQFQYARRYTRYDVPLAKYRP